MILIWIILTNSPSSFILVTLFNPFIIVFLFEAEPKDSISKSTLANSGRKLAIVELESGLIGKPERDGIEAVEERHARLLSRDDWA